MAVVESQQAGALLIGLEKATYLIKRCRIYELLYLQSEHTDQEMDKDSIANLRSALVVLYAAILGFLAAACSFYERSHSSRFFHGILNPEGSLTFITECETLERKVDLEARNCEGVHADERGRKLKKLLTDLQNPILRVDSKVDKLCQNLDVEARPEILRWISTIPYKENHLTARQEWTKGTGEWLLNHEQYLKWRSSSSSSILWLHGIRKFLIT